MAPTLELPTNLPMPARLIVEGPDGIRRFLDSDLQGLIDRSLASLPPSIPTAVVVHGKVDGQGGELSLAVRVRKSWSIAIGGYKDWSGPWAGQVKVVWVPPAD